MQQNGQQRSGIMAALLGLNRSLAPFSSTYSAPIFARLKEVSVNGFIDYFTHALTPARIVKYNPPSWLDFGRPGINETVDVSMGTAKAIIFKFDDDSVHF